MDKEEREQLQSLLRELMVWKEDFAENEKRFSNLWKKFNELYDKLDKRLDGDG